MSLNYKLITLFVLIAIMLLAVQMQSAFATTNPNKRSDRQMHGVLTWGNKGTVAKATSTLTDQANVSWAKAFTGEFILTWDSFGNGVVGAGWLHYKDNSNNIHNSMASYYYDVFHGTTGLGFAGEEGGSAFSALTLRGTFDSINNCRNWSITLGTSYSENRCISSFDSGLGEVWSISNSGSNTFLSGTEYAGLQYYPATGGGAANWSSSSASEYCWDDSPFVTNLVTDRNNWNVSPPGSGTACDLDARQFTSAKPILP
ncbi:hypothetical protein NTE_01177 [Candidatus Nitrososphaera evergladensis SR1]|uniref:Uncharacterized protein n=1 Tax=Candidatus Nitrososphaera evergladensis SR1 TaxID=1459636 RepID=A0A075MQA1_9ARCH|nr:hypothetical protein [Candidatus Nitrososphaera evergladensis]AIF83250.1 hypothetical protein NTE_01177 [Candidatus Nitrososphaera evergladensis SR1]